MKLNPLRSRVGIFTTCLGACTLLITSATGLSNTERREWVTAYETIQFGKDGLSAPLLKDPETGHLSIMVRFAKGVYPSHFHTFHYQVVVVKGTLIHKTEGLPDAEAKPLGPGSFWYQPAGKVHQDTCVSEECVLFMVSTGEGETHQAPLRRELTD